jgi:hypothetical protein
MIIADNVNTFLCINFGIVEFPHGWCLYIILRGKLREFKACLTPCAALDAKCWSVVARNGTSLAKTFIENV